MNFYIDATIKIPTTVSTFSALKIPEKTQFYNTKSGFQNIKKNFFKLTL